MTRLTYVKVSNQELVSAKPLITLTDLVTVRVDLNSLTFKVVGSEGNIVSKGHGTNKVDLQKNIKKELISLGVKFADEIRKVYTKRADKLISSSNDLRLTEGVTGESSYNNLSNKFLL